MPLLSPRRLAFRGTIEVAALAFARSLFPPAALQARVWSLWQSGARLEEFDWGHVLFFQSPQKMRAALAPATPLIKTKNRLVAAPIEREDELSEGVWIIEGGEWRELSGGRAVDVSLWLDVGKWSVPDTTSLGDVPAVPLALAPVELDLREQSGIGAPDKEWQTIWERGGKNRLLSELAPGFWLQQASRLVTPPREVNGKVVASDGSIVLSATLVLGGALLFFLLSFASPSKAGFSSFGLMAVVMMLGLTAFLRRRQSPASEGMRSIPLFVVSAKVQLIALVLVAFALLRVAIASPDIANIAFVFLFVAWRVARNTALLGRLVGTQTQPVGVNGAPASPSGARSGSGKSWLVRWLRSRGQQNTAPNGAAKAITSWLSRRKGKDGAAGKPARDPLGDAWRRLLAQAAMQSGLFKTLGRAQARFLLRSMELFERGDLEAALRHAIPLGGKSEKAAPPSLGVPGLRDNLSISPFQLAARGSLNFGPDIEEKLRALYRRAFEKLRDAGDLDKAAFVLAELLNNSEEAVAFLEKHERLELAAQIAEARGLPPGLVVRQWWIAGKRERAVALAQLHNAFADAITRLERDPKLRADALALRLLWGHYLAQSGRFGAAVEAVKSVPEGLPFARRWLRLGLEEHLSPSLLVRALELEPGSWCEWQPQLLALCNDDRTRDGARDRLRLARELGRQHGSSDEAKPVLQVAARVALRAHLRDASSGTESLDKAEWERLHQTANDGILRADVRVPTQSRRASPPVPLELRFEKSEGLLVARDAVVTQSGELLVALGEAGAQLRARDGRIKAHFDVPAHKIVRPFDGSRFLLLAPRDESWRVSKLDLSNRQTSFWGDLGLNHFCDEFDGAVWFVASEGRVRALDVAGETPRSLWDSGDLNGSVQGLALSRNSLAAMIGRFGGNNELLCESWRFELPSLVLRERRTPPGFPLVSAPGKRRLISSNGRQHDVQLKEDNGSSVLTWGEERAGFPVEHDARELLGARIGAHNDVQSAMIFWRGDEGAVASLFAWQSGLVKARLRFSGASRVEARDFDSGWLVWDDLGRVVLFNPQSGDIEREWTL